MTKNILILPILILSLSNSNFGSDRLSYPNFRHNPYSLQEPEGKKDFRQQLIDFQQTVAILKEESSEVGLHPQENPTDLPPQFSLPPTQQEKKDEEADWALLNNEGLSESPSSPARKSQRLFQAPLFLIQAKHQKQ